MNSFIEIYILFYLPNLISGYEILKLITLLSVKPRTSLLNRFRPFVNLDMAEHTHHANRKQHSIEKKVESDGFRREFVTVFEEVDNVAE